MNVEQISALLKHAKQNGMHGFGGDCGAAAIAINRIVFDNKGKLVGSFNQPFLQHGYSIGHVAVLYDDVFWDADGRPKSEDEITSWAMLDVEDSDYAELAEEFGITWDDEAAETVYFCEFDNAKEVLQHFPSNKLREYVRILTDLKKGAY